MSIFLEESCFFRIFPILELYKRPFQILAKKVQSPDLMTIKKAMACLIEFLLSIDCTDTIALLTLLQFLLQLVLADNRFGLANLFFLAIS